MNRTLSVKAWLFAVLALAMMTSGLVAFAAVSPAEYSAELGAGQEVTIEKQVGVGETAEKVDVYILADTTGSMGDVLAAVQANAGALLASISADIADVQFGAGDYKDFPSGFSNPYAFSNGAGIGPDDGIGGNPDASDAIAAWTAFGGGDGPEGQFYALDQIAKDPSIGWRPGAQRIVVWFGDAPGHDPVCAAISGLGYDIDEASLISDLQTAEITVVAISTITAAGGFYPDGLDSFTLYGGDYVPDCGFESPASGQATRIADATGGSYLQDVPAADIADAILEGIRAVTVDITGSTVGDCSPLSVSLSPAVWSGVVGPDTVTFDETISVAAGTAPGEYECQVLFTASGGEIGVQDITITVPNPIEGRMTGGGSVFTEDGMRVTHGFELHCDASEPNNIQVNWGRGQGANSFHLDELTSASCSNDPDLDAGQPTNDFNTFTGAGTGSFNGVEGATIEFTFTDNGEPGSLDNASIVIADSSGEVLNVDGNLNNGNHQAHK